ncbi:MAG: antitoxin [Paraburkholderia tropica]|nr:antitoxin [Paraburkholderia tropica]
MRCRVRASATHSGTTSTPLAPLVSEFATAEEAEAYDRWFRARVEASLADPRPSIPHDEAMASIRAKLGAELRRLSKAT